MIKTRIWNIQKLEIDLKKHRKCYEGYIAEYYKYVCSGCSKIIVDIYTLKTEIKYIIKSGGKNEN